jgi:S-adenosylmethionine-diacylgycerolhomoserine-N-methlytransferase
MSELTADARTLWRLLRGQPTGGSHAANLQTFYAPQAERYDAFRARLLHGRKELITQLKLQAGSHVVELGCGTGSSLQIMGDSARQLGRFDLVDLCPALLAVAEQRAKNYPAAQVIEADATSWRPTVTVDVVFMSYSLTMMPHWPAVVANAKAMLKPGGRFGIVDFYLPETASAIGNAFWQRWFAHDGVHLSSQHLPLLRQTFKKLELNHCRARVPYLPGLRAPYYRFIGRKE